MLNSGIVDQNIHAPEALLSIFDEAHALRRMSQVGRIVHHAHSIPLLQAVHQFPDLGDGRCETVDFNCAACSGKRVCEPQPYAGGGPGDNSNSAFQHGFGLLLCERSTVVDSRT